MRKSSKVSITRNENVSISGALKIELLIQMVRQVENLWDQLTPIIQSNQQI